MASFLLLAGGAWGAAADKVAVGSDGELMELESGLYGELFPEGAEAAPQAAALALTISRADSVERHLVPGSESIELEESPALYHDPTVGVTYVVWSSRYNGIHPYLRVVPFHEGWGEVVDIIGSVFQPKFDPRISTQHETWTLDDGTEVERTMLDVLWWEEGVFGTKERFKSLVLEDGVLIGASQIQAVSELLTPTGKMGMALPGDDARMHLVSLSRGFILGFTDVEAQQVRILSFDHLPLALSRLAVAVEEAARTYDPSSGKTLEETVLDTLGETAGDDFHPAILQALAADLLSFVEEETGSGIVAQRVPDHVVDKIGPHIIHIGARMKSAGLVGQDVKVLRIEAEGSAVSRLHHVAVSELSSWALPETPNSPQLFVSKRGNAALLAWDTEDGVAYRETLKGAWGPEQALEVTETLDRDTIYRILEERALER